MPPAFAILRLLMPPRRRLAPDLARLPIKHNLRALSMAEGVRAALSVSVIIALGEYLNMASLREAGLGALLTCLCDPGGPIRRRVSVLLTFAILGGMIMGGLGLLRGLGPAVALPVGVMALFAASFARVYGQATQQAGALLSTAIILSLDRAMPPPAAAQVAAAFTGGALWATILTMVVWRLHPYQSIRLAVAEVYHALADLTGDLRTLLRNHTVDETAWETHARARRSAVRDAIEAARAGMLDTLRGRGAGGLRASQSLIRLETGDQIFGTLIALSDLLEQGTSNQRAVAARMLRRLRPLLSTLADVARTDPAGAYPRVKRTIDKLAPELAALPSGDSMRPIAERLVERLRIADTLSVTTNFPPGIDPDDRRVPPGQRLIRPLRANLDWRSPTLRHAIRSAATAAPALAFTMAWFTPYDHWLTITIVATMQPFFALTFARAVERIAGTVLGGLVAAAVGLVCTTPFSIGLAMFPLAVAAMAVRAVNFGLFMLALTPVVVLLVEAGEPDTSEWRIALARATLTIAGGLIAVASSFILWPGREPRRLMAAARDAIVAHALYAETALSSLLDEIPAAAVDAARREAGLASNMLEASINRALIEPGAGGRDMLEAVLVIDAALRRCAGRLSAMQLDPAGLRAVMPPNVLRVWRDWIGGSMRALAAGRIELPPRPNTVLADAPGRIARQIALMAGAMERLPE